MPKGIYPRRVKRDAITQPFTEPYRFIPLTQGQIAIVDVEDFERLSEFNWAAHRTTCGRKFIADRRLHGTDRHIKMHRDVLRLLKGEEADHKNGNPLDNRKGNLRKCERPQNMANRGLRADNTSGFMGVSWSKKHRKWLAAVSANGNRICVGQFDDATEAAKARDVRAMELHGEFAVLNFPHQ